MPDVLVRRASRDDLHPRTGCLPPLARSGGGASQQATGIQYIYLFASLRTIATLYNEVISNDQLRPTYSERQNTTTFSSDSSQPDRHHAHSHRSCLELSRMFARNVLSDTRADTSARTSSSALPESSQQRQHGQSGAKTCFRNCKTPKVIHRSGRTKR